MNSPNRSTISRRSNADGAALIITLAFLVLVAIMVVGMMESVRVERSASRTHYERMRATMFAQQGVDRALASLRQATADRPKQPGEKDEDYQKRTRNWASQPGRLLVPDPRLLNSKNSVDLKRIAAEVPMNSGVPTTGLDDDSGAYPEFLRPPDLNLPTLLDPTSHLITEEEVLNDGMNNGGQPGSGAARTIQMKVRWMYVRKDGTYAKDDTGQFTDVPDLTDKKNPIVGRFAYWADDEGTKVNYNLAWTRHPDPDPDYNNPNGEGHQTRVGLDALLDASTTAGGSWKAVLATRLHQFVTPDNFKSIGRFFNTPFEARQVSVTNGAIDPVLAEALRVNKFNLTHYNHDPDTTFYGLPRLMLTTQPEKAVRRDSQGNVMRKNGIPVFRPFLNITKRSSPSNLDYVDPGYLNNIDASKLSDAVRNLVNNYLKKNDWPMLDRGSSSSLQTKYYAEYSAALREERLAQLAINIIEYVRSAESGKLIVEPIRGKYNQNTGVFTADFVDGSIRGNKDTFKGVVRAPMITEMGIWMATNPEAAGVNKGRYRTYGFIEIHLPENYGIDELDLLNPEGKQWRFYFGEFSNRQYYDSQGKLITDPEQPVGWRLTKNTPGGPPAFVWDALNKNPNVPASPGMSHPTKMRPGEYRTIAFEAFREGSRPATAMLRTAITINNPGGYRIDVAPLSNDGGSITLPLPKDILETEITTVETSDPRVNGVVKDWRQNNSLQIPRNTMFGLYSSVADNRSVRRNKRYAEDVGSIPKYNSPGRPEQDTDLNGNVTNASFRMPYPKGYKHKDDKGETIREEPGLVRSSGELGLIHTGIEGNNDAPNGGTPWRTLRLQPSSLETKVVPDWAFMDLFTVPADVPEKAAWLFNPHTTATGGRVNMNAHPEPFTMNRIAPLAAVLINAPKDRSNPPKRVTFSEAQQIAANIYNRVLARPLPGRPAGKAYGDNGRFAHYDSPGEVVEIEGVANRGEESEELVREIANLISSRSNVFTVYTVGQALRQTPDGKLLVTSEQRQQAMLERYIESDLVTGTNAIDYTKFRTVYFRNLIP